jgi:CRISPR/Cas system-associated exonuclease Cas4 (RecB family)
MTQVAWSFSRIKSYEDCPRKYWHESVGKTIPFVETEEMSYGKDWHKAAELYIKRGQKLPLSMLHWEPVLAKFKDAPGEKVVEQQICLNAQWQQVEWYAKDAWLRVKSDLTIINGASAVQIDYKTGKPKDDFTQLRLNSAVTFHLVPELQEITHGFLWTKNNMFTSEKMKLADVSAFWATMLPRVARYQQAHDQQNFPPKQGYLCGKYCKVKSCQFNGV